MITGICLDCERQSVLKAKGLCKVCYNKLWRKTEKGKNTQRRVNEARKIRASQGRYYSSKLYKELSARPCFVCGWKEAHRDIHHIIPRKEDGSDLIDNLITLCPNHHRLADLEIISREELKEYSEKFYFQYGKIEIVSRKQVSKELRQKVITLYKTGNYSYTQLSNILGISKTYVGVIVNSTETKEAR